MPGPRWFAPLAAILVAGLAASDAAACPFCAAQGQTLSGEVNQADFIVLGTLTNAQRDPNDFSKGSTDLVVETVVKPHPYLAGKKTVTIPRYVPVDPKAGGRFLVFCSLYSRPVDFSASAVASAAALANYDAAQLDAYRGEPVASDSRLGEYLKGSLEVREKDAKGLGYFFDFLDAPDLVISTDAMNEFAGADYADVRRLAEHLPPEKVKKLAGWLRDPNTPPSRLGLYALMLGHAGTKDDAAGIRSLLDSPDKAATSGLDGLLAAYVLLDKPAGWAYVSEMLKAPAGEFAARFAGLKVLRFFWDFRTDVVGQAEVLDGMKSLASHADVADLPIEDLRKWGRWDLTPFVLDLAGREGHKKIPIVRRSILRFCLAAPADQAAAKAYVDEARKQDPEKVKFIEQTLQDELPKPASSTPPVQQPNGGK